MYVPKWVTLALCLMAGAGGTVASGTAAAPVTVTIGGTSAGKITVGSGWSTWSHWWGATPSGVAMPGDYRDSWTDAQWNAYFQILKDSGADWIRLDYYYGASEPRDSNANPAVIDFSKFTMESPKLIPLKRHLSFCDANGIDAYVTFTYNRCNVEYNADKATGWNSTNAVNGGFPTLWTRPNDAPVDKRKIARNMAATVKHLLVDDDHPSLKQVCLYVEPDAQWTGVDGILDTAFFGSLLKNLGIRSRLKIIANHAAAYNAPPADPAASDFDLYGIEDYSAKVDFAQPQLGLQKLAPIYQTLVGGLKAVNPARDAVLAEHGVLRTPGNTTALPAYLDNLSESCKVIQVYNYGFAGTNRWALEPIAHPLEFYGVVKVAGVTYPTASIDNSYEQFIAMVTPIKQAMLNGALLQKVPHNFEPARLLMSNLRRGSTVLRTTITDPAGKGVYSIAVKDGAGKWRVGLVNLYPSAQAVTVSFPVGPLPASFRWEYYDATLPAAVQEKAAPALVGNTLPLTLSARSINFLIEGSGPIPVDPLPVPWKTQDIGSVGVAGSADESGGTFTLCGSGADVWGTVDAFRYAYQTLNGDGEIVARVAGVENTAPWAKAGVMIRETLAPGSKHAMTIVTPANGAAFQRRVATGGITTHTAGPAVSAPYWVKLGRSGSLFTSSVSPDGVNWIVVGTETIPMAASVYVGLLAASLNDSVLNCVDLDSVSGSGGWQPPTVGPAPGGGGGGSGSGGCGATGLEAALLLILLQAFRSRRRKVESPCTGE